MCSVDRAMREGAMRPQDSTPSDSCPRLTWQHSSETFTLATSHPRTGNLAPGALMPVLADRLFLMRNDSTALNSSSSTMHYFTMDQELRYTAFCSDYGYVLPGVSGRLRGPVLLRSADSGLVGSAGR